jgi:hypothetical protein
VRRRPGAHGAMGSCKSKEARDAESKVCGRGRAPPLACARGVRASKSCAPPPNPRVPPHLAQAGDVSVQNMTFAFNFELDKGEGNELGTGQFSVVRRAHRKKDGAAVAVKCIEKASLTEEDLQVRARRCCCCCARA